MRLQVWIAHRFRLLFRPIMAVDWWLKGYGTLRGTWELATTMRNFNTSQRELGNR